MKNNKKKNKKYYKIIEKWPMGLKDLGPGALGLRGPGPQGPGPWGLGPQGPGAQGPPRGPGPMGAPYRFIECGPWRSRPIYIPARDPKQVRNILPGATFWSGILESSPERNPEQESRSEIPNRNPERYSEEESGRGMKERNPE